MNEQRFVLLSGLRAAAQDATGGAAVLLDLAIAEIERLDKQINQLLQMISERHHADPVETALNIANILDDRKGKESDNA